MFKVSMRDSHAALTQTALRVKRVSIAVRLFQVLISFLCCISLSYSLTHPGYWTNFAVASACTYSVASLSAILDLQQLFFYTQHRTGSTIFLHNVHPNDINPIVKSQYGLFLFAQSVSFLGWATAAVVLWTMPHGKNFQYAFNPPPYAAWYVTAGTSCVQMVSNLFMCVLIHRDNQILGIHLEDLPQHAHVPRTIQGGPASTYRSSRITGLNSIAASASRSTLPGPRSLATSNSLQSIEMDPYPRIHSIAYPESHLEEGMFPNHSNVEALAPADSIEYRGNWI